MKVVGLGAPDSVRIRFAPSEVDLLVDVLREQRASATLKAADTYCRVRREDTRAVDDRHDRLRAIEGLLVQLEDQAPDDRGRVVLVGETKVMIDVVHDGGHEALRRLQDAHKRYHEHTHAGTRDAARRREHGAGVDGDAHELRPGRPGTGRMTSALATINGYSTATGEVEAAGLRRLMICHGQAAERHRTIAGRLLGLDRTEAAAMALFGTSPVLSVGAFTDRLALSPGGTSLLIKRLERRGGIERRAHPHDYRRVLLMATNSHIEAAAALYAPLTTRLDELVRQLPAATRREVIAWLPHVIAVLHEHADALLIERQRRERVVATPAAPGPWA